MTDTHDADAIVRRVLGRYLDAQEAAMRRTGSTRCTLVVDATTDGLAAALGDANFHVVRAGSALLGYEERRTLLSHRILITTETASYHADAPVLDFGVVGLDALAVVDAAETYSENTTALLISSAVTERHLISVRGGWVLMLVPNGEHVFLGLE
jgi:hypothetical protein